MKPELKELVTLLLEVHSFCGSIERALRDWQKENRQLTELERYAVLCSFSETWEKWQKEAKEASNA